MRVKLPALLLVSLFVPTIAFADAHKADFSGDGTGGTGGSTLAGFLVSANWGLPVCPWLDAVGPDVSVQFGGHEGKSLTQVVFQGGGRVFLTSFDRTKDTPYKPFVHVMIGGVYTNIDGAGGAVHDFAVTIGAGYEHFWTKSRIKGHDGQVHDHYGGLGVRAQADLVMRPGDGEKFMRYSAGLVYRLFPDKEK